MAALLQRIIADSGWTAEQMAEISNCPVLLRMLKFGKYRGQKIEDIAEQDPDYLRWMLKSIKALSGDMRFSIEHYLSK